MAFNTQEREIIKWGLSNGKSQQEVETAISNFRQGITPTQPRTEGVDESFTGGLKQDLSTRTDRFGDISARQDTGPIEKKVQQFGQGAGLAADVIERTVEQIPGVKPVLGAIGAGINWLATSKFSPAKILGDQIGKSKALQETVELYDTDENFKDSVDAVANIARLGGDVQLASDAVRLTKSATSKIVSGARVIAPKVSKAVSTAASKTKASQFVRDVTPTKQGLINESVSKALDFNPSDLNKIARATGNDVGVWLSDKNLIGVNKATTATNIEKVFSDSFSTVRSEIAKITNTYKISEVPNYTKALTQVNKKINGVAGLEPAAQKVSALLKKKTVTLSDVQRAKELLDEHFSLYKITGDVAAGAEKLGLSNIRRNLRKFIEEQVELNGGADIKLLNNDVSTSKTILETIKTRSPKGLTRSNLKIGDLGAFGVGSVYGGPIGGLAAVLFKKLVESPSVRLRFAKWLDKVSDAQKAKLLEELRQGKVPAEVVEVTGI